MRARHNVGSSASIIIITILFLALMATLGVVFYQNFIQKPTAKPEVITTEKPTIVTKTARVAFNNVIYDLDYPGTGWSVTTTPGTNVSSMTAKNTAGTAQVSINFSQANANIACSPSDGLQIESYSVSGAVAGQLIGAPLYLVSAIYDHVGGGYQYVVGLSPDSGNTHASVGGSHCDISSVGNVSPAILNGSTLVQPAIETSITFPKLPQEPKPAAPDMQTLKNLMNSDDYTAAVKILESARKE